MNINKWLGFTVITLIIGFMIAVQYQTIKEPVVRDTRDTWELRKDLERETKLKTKLLNEIRKYDEKIDQYENDQEHTQELALRETLDELKKDVGLTESSGSGITMYIGHLFNEQLTGQPVKDVSPQLLRRMINELNTYGAEEISIAGQRIINTTVIRDINGVTKIDGYRLKDLPIEIKVIAKDAQKLHDKMKVSNAIDELAMESFSLELHGPIKEVTIPAYDDTIREKFMEPVKAEEEGDS